jgi:hypothetical protein
MASSNPFVVARRSSRKNRPTASTRGTDKMKALALASSGSAAFLPSRE